MAGYAFEYEPYPTVTPSGAPGNDFFNIHASEGAFGARKARALEEVGQGAEKLGESQLNMDSQAHATELHSWQSDQHNDAQSEFTALKGRAAIDGLPAYRQKLEDGYKDAVAQAANPATKLMVQTEGRRMLDNFKEIGTRHADAQRDQYYKTTAIGAQESAIDRAATYAQNGRFDDMDHALWMAGQEVQNQYDPPTRGPLDEREQAAVDEQIKRAYGKGVYNIVDTFAKQGRFPAAEAIFKKYDDAGKIDADSRLRITAALETHRAQREGQSIFDDAYNKAQQGTGYTVPAGIPRITPRLVSQAETGDPTLGPKALGNISRDAGGTKSYGFTGLNSGSGSLAAFLRENGEKFGLRGPIGSAGFDAQWHAASTEQTKDFRDAQLKFFADHDVATVRRDLQSVGVPGAITNDPRVVAYFADRHVQMGNLALSQAGYAWDRANGDVPAFLKNMTAIDARPENLQSNFRTAIATGVYGPAGHATRLRTRLNTALAADNDDGEPPADGALPAAYVPGQAPGQSQVPGQPQAPGPGLPETFGGVPTMVGASPTQRVSIAQPGTAASLKSSIFQNILDDPRAIENPGWGDAALARAKRTLDAQEIAENQTTKLRKEVSDQSAGAYVTAMFDMMHMPKPDYVALAGKINHDPNLEWKTKQELMDRIKRVSGEEQALAFGPGYLSAREGLFSPVDAPGHISDFSSLVTRNDITTAGLADLQHRWQIAKGSVDKSATEKIVNSYLTYAKKQMSFEEDNGFIKIRDPKGEAIFNSEFVPLFVRQASALQNEAEKTGDRSKLDKFLTRENVSKMVQSFRDPREMAADKMAATGVSAAVPEVPNAPLPPAPEGVNAEGWKGVVAKPPMLSTGQRATRAQWAQALEILQANPTPAVQAKFDAYMGASGYSAKDVLAKLGIKAEAAQAAAAATLPPTMAGQEQRLPPSGPQLDHAEHAKWRDETTTPAPAPAKQQTEAELHPEAPDPRAQRRAERAAEQAKVDEQQRQDRERWEAERQASAREAETARQTYEQHLTGARERRAERHAAEPQKQAERARQNYIEVLKDREKHLLGAPGDVITPAIKQEIERVRAELKALQP